MSSFQIALLQDTILILTFIILAVFLAKKRNRNIYLWGLAGALIIPALILLFLPKVNDE